MRPVVKTVLRLIIVVGILCFSLPAVAAETGPSAPVTTLQAALLHAMRGGADLGLQGRYRLLAPVIDEVFALPLMARISAGRFWQELTPEQKQRYLTVYRRWTITSYASNFDRYNGEKFETPKKPKPAGRVTDVRSIFTQKEGAPVIFDYKMLRTGSGWRIADVRVKGVSQLALTRTQFVEILAHKGIDGLLAMLKKKIAAITAGGKPDPTTGNGS